MDREELSKMTVTMLRDQVKADLPDAKGATGMKKDELVDLLMAGGRDSGGGAKPAAPNTKSSGSRKPSGGALTKADIKSRIRELKEAKRTAVADGDEKSAGLCNRRIHVFKHQLRKMNTTAAKAPKSK